MENVRITYVLVPLVSIVLYFLVRKQGPRTIPGYGTPPRFRPLEPFIGLDYRIKTTLDAVKWLPYFERYSKTYEVATLLLAPDIVTADADNVYEIFAGKDWGVGWRQNGMGQLVGKGLLTMDGEGWTKARKMFKPCFARSNIDDLEFVAHIFDEMLAKIPEDGKVVDMQPLLYDAFVRTSLHFIYGVKEGDKSLGAPLSTDELNETWRKGLMGMALRLLFFKFSWILPPFNYAKLCAQIHDFVDFYISRSISRTEQGVKDERKSMVDIFLSQSENKQYVQSQLVQGMLASQDTTSTLTGHLVELLARNPSVWKELKQEVREQGDALSTYDGLRENKIIQNILMETLRLRTTFPALARKAIRDTTLPTGGGSDGQSPIFVPQGTVGIVVPYALHQDPTVFGPDVEVFNPHRWDTIKPGPRQFTPFGIGGRSCLGKDKALNESAYLLVRLAREFEDIEFRGKSEFVGTTQFSMRNADGCKVAFRKGGSSL